MAGAYPKPRFRYEYDLDKEKSNFDLFFSHRKIPQKRPSEIDIGTWNIANFGDQKRRKKDLELIAHIIAHFDIMAIQEVRANLKHLNEVLDFLPERYQVIFTDVAGGGERLAVIYDATRIELGGLVGELDYNPNGTIKDGVYVVQPKKQKFKLSGATIETYFENFNRNPFLTTWKVKDSNKSFMLANVHVYFGARENEDQARFNNRIAEVYFLSDWAYEMQKAKNKKKVYEQNIIMIGDMNVPKMSSDDKVYRALKRRGFVRTQYSSRAGSTIQEFNTYDQIIFSNSKLKQKKIKGHNAVVVDFDNFVFPELWQQVESGKRTLPDFKAYTKFAISDHRPVFVRVKV